LTQQTRTSPVAVLLVQLGTPDAPTVPAVRRYLRQFLGDPRVIETPRLPWWFILNFSILRTRPGQSAAKYQRIWSPQTGSPLRYYTRRQAEKLQALLPGTAVRFAMQIGNPSVAEVLRDLIAVGVERLIVVPMYPQYSATTTASATDALFKALLKERRVPALRIVPPYFAHPAYVDALTNIIQDDLARLIWEPEHYILSFHGIPLSYVEKGDPYPEQVRETTRLLLERLKWPEGKWTQTYQSIFGRAEWLRPYTEETLVHLAKRGIRGVYVATPGFTADCLETIDEIGFEVKEAFLRAGGQELHRCPCLNDHDAWIQAMRTLVLEEGRGWIEAT
jgi:ferrochelatase